MVVRKHFFPLSSTVKEFEHLPFSLSRIYVNQLSYAQIVNKPETNISIDKNIRGYNAQDT